MKYNLHTSKKIIFNIRRFNLNLDAWWPSSLKQNERKLQQLKNPEIYITRKKVMKFKVIEKLSLNVLDTN
jgi:hypothetical protein